MIFLSSYNCPIYRERGHFIRGHSRLLPFSKQPQGFENHIETIGIIEVSYDYFADQFLI